MREQEGGEKALLRFPSGWSDHSLRWEVQEKARGLIFNGLM